MVAALLMPYKLLAFGLSDIGLVRQNNEDIWAALPEDGFFLLADGMGGHQAGEVAARETANMLCRIVRKKIAPMREAGGLADSKELMRRAIRHVNTLVYKLSRTQDELRGMGTTLCCLLFHEHSLIFAHVGDSRIYRFRDGKLQQLTSDHSLLRELVDQGQLNEREASDFVYKNIITKAIGTEPKVEPTVDTADVLPNDLYLMCSDGLSDLLTAQEIQAIIKAAATIQQAATQLVACANEKGGRDNITVVFTKVEELHESKDLSR